MLEIRFLDTIRFMPSSLDTLAGNLSEENFNVLKSQYKNKSDFELLRRKGVFPYEYLDSVEKLDETSLPPRSKFYSNLTESECSEEDYAHAIQVWHHFNCRSLKEYLELYLKTDVLLLTDVFQNFRAICSSIYNLDPAHYYTTPGLSWDAMLKTTEIELELLTDIDMITYVKSGIRGGLVQCSHRHTKANHKYLKNFDPTKESEFLMYVDANNLYGWAMSEPLPYGEFKWLDTNQIKSFNLENIHENSEYGYILEVDLDYPYSLHDEHNDLPFCPDNKLPSSSCKTPKLIADLAEKKNYIIYYKTLKQCMRHGLELKKIHSILQFRQKAWLKKYIDINTEHRTRAKNNFEKDFFKLLNNAVYGKTMENSEKRVDVRIITEWDYPVENRKLGRPKLCARDLISKSNFHSASRFSETMYAIQMKRLHNICDKPIYLGFVVLEMSKYKMYDFHYDYMKPKFGKALKLNYMDTDSFIYSIKTQ
ncbi:uncharacterized protein LOC127566360 [Drosophila albomicans]|uniref:Uncharacterized protein LOC127566360 n=1 Tax=Drosophila albomicans TaxID=7291 RepID=A0A9C6TD93_DROAB|nr:uncharacterized protein LOC127566360 [Drosophila albomicans]